MIVFGFHLVLFSMLALSTDIEMADAQLSQQLNAEYKMPKPVSVRFFDVLSVADMIQHYQPVHFLKCLLLSETHCHLCFCDNWSNGFC